MLVGAAVVLVAQHQRAIGHGVGRVAKRSLPVRLGLAYPLARRFRTSMTLGMFALVVFILVLVSVFASMFAGQIGEFTRDASGGFNVVVAVEPEQPGAVRRARARARRARGRAARRRSTVQVAAAPGPHRAAASGRRPASTQRFVDARRRRSSTTAARYRERRRRVPRPCSRRPEPRDRRQVRSSPAGGGPPRQARRHRRPVHRPATWRAAPSARSPSPRSARHDSRTTACLIGHAGRAAASSARARSRTARTSTSRDPDAFADAFAGRYLANGGKAETIRGIVARRARRTSSSSSC